MAKQPADDSAFLYLLFTLQFFILLIGGLIYLRSMVSKERRAKKSFKGIYIQGLILVFVGLWFYQTYGLVQEVSQEFKEFDPYSILNVKQGTFNTPEIKKSYRNLAKKLHPDKNPKLNKSPEAVQKF